MKPRPSKTDHRVTAYHLLPLGERFEIMAEEVCGFLRPVPPPGDECYALVLDATGAPDLAERLWPLLNKALGTIFELALEQRQPVVVHASFLFGWIADELSKIDCLNPIDKETIR